MLKRAKPSPSKYAQLVPKLRALKSKLITLDRVREVVAQPSLEEAVSFLKDTIYGEALSSGDLASLQRSLTEFYCSRLDSIAKATPREASPLIEAFKHEVEAGDLVVVAQAVGRGGERPETSTKNIESCEAMKALSEPDALTSTTRFLEVVQGTWASRYQSVLKKVIESRGSPLASWARLVIVAGEYSRALEALEPRVSRRAAARVLCPYLNWMIAASLLQAKREGVEARLLEEVLVNVPSCGFRLSRARLVYEREAGVEGLIASISEAVPGVRIEASKDLVEALESARVEARRESARRASGIFSGFPFHAGILAAGVMLLKFNIEDLVTVLHGVALRLPSEEYLPVTTLS